MAVGITSDTKKRTVNLTQLRKNTRKRPDKTSGRKRPRLDDVVPAGDQDAQQAADIRAAVFPDHTPGTVAETSSQGTSTGTRTSVNQDICCVIINSNQISLDPRLAIFTVHQQESAVAAE